MNTWWYIHTATLFQLSCRWTPYDICIRQLYINFPADEHLMIYAYRNFISTFLQMNTWWFITYRNFTSTFLQMNTLWYIHTATLYQLYCRWTPDDIYIPYLYTNFSGHEHVMIYTYRNFISIFLITRGNIYRLQRFFNFPVDEHVLIYLCCNFISFFLWTRDDRYFCRSFLSTFLEIRTW